MNRWQKLNEVFAKYPVVPSQCSLSGSFPQYGTSGFRGAPDVILPIACRMAALMAVRSVTARTQFSHDEQSKIGCGICFTASHNPSSDNGVKLIDINGEMLPVESEAHATEMVESSDESAIQMLRDELERHAIGEAEMETVCVSLGQDSRPSGERMIAACREVLDALGVACVDCGMVTTPEMHFLIRSSFESATNTMQVQDSVQGVRRNTAAPHNYIDHLVSVFEALFEQCDRKNAEKWTVVIDCANGVGSLKFKALQKRLASHVQIELVNIDTSDPNALNRRCGSDYYLETNQWSIPVEPSSIKDEHRTVFVAVDGDCDRVICAVPVNGRLTILNGDFLQTLFIVFLRRLQSQISLPLSLVAVQTPYANGNSTKFLQNDLLDEVRMVPTGVKHCHRAATVSDVGVYFEANGHGSIVFSPATRDKLRDAVLGSKTSAERILYNLSNLLSQTCGDAIANTLCVLLALEYCGMTPQHWAVLFRPLPSCSAKVTQRRSIPIRTNWAQTRIIDPEEMQQALDTILENARALVGKDATRRLSLRCFVRPSGTEPVLRVYVESESDVINKRIVNEIRRYLESYTD